MPLRHLAIFLLAVFCLPLALAGVDAQTVSSLPPASTPLDGTELLYIVQHGVSKKTTTGSLPFDLPENISGPHTASGLWTFNGGFNSTNVMNGSTQNYWGELGALDQPFGGGGVSPILLDLTNPTNVIDSGINCGWTLNDPSYSGSPPPNKTCFALYGYAAPGTNGNGNLSEIYAQSSGAGDAIAAYALLQDTPNTVATG